MYGTMKEHLRDQLAQIEEDGLYKRERVIAGPQQARVDVAGRRVLNMCANNYLGLAGHPEIVEAAQAAIVTTTGAGRSPRTTQPARGRGRWRPFRDLKGGLRGGAGRRQRSGGVGVVRNLPLDRRQEDANSRVRANPSSEIPSGVHLLLDPPPQFQQRLHSAANLVGVFKGCRVVVGVRKLVPQLPDLTEMPPQFPL